MKRGTRCNPRRCVASGESLPKSELVRFAVGPDGAVVPDVAGKLPGRGIWVKANRAAVERAASRRLFQRSARRHVEIPADLTQAVEAQLCDRVVGLIAIARKSGAAVAGYTNVRSALAARSVGILLQASDGSQAQMRKVRAQDCNIARFGCLSAKELGIAFRRDHVIHAAVVSGGIAARISEEARRLYGFRS